MWVATHDDAKGQQAQSLAQKQREVKTTTEPVVTKAETVKQNLG